MADQNADFSQDYIRSRIASVPYWWHQIELAPGIVTPGKDGSQAKKERLRLPEDLTGKRVLDIGAYDGFFTFECERRGADVTALDNISPNECGFGVAHEILHSNARHLCQSVYDLNLEQHGTFDLVLFLGVIYHLRHPLLALDRIYSICGDLMILESQICDDEFLNPRGQPVSLRSYSPELDASPLAQFYPADELNHDPTNWWSPNLIALQKMIETSGFDPTLVYSDGRRAVFHCKKLPKRPEWVEQTLTPMAENPALADQPEMMIPSTAVQSGEIDLKFNHLIYPQNPYATLNEADYPLDLEGWNSRYPNFERMIDEIQPHLIIEVGSWKGASAIHMAGLLAQKKLPAQIICVDTWLGSADSWQLPQNTESGRNTPLSHGYPTLFYQFLANVKHYGMQNMITPLPQPSLSAARWLRERRVTADLVFIDASHEEDDVYADLQYYWPILREGGAMFGDDYDKLSVSKGVHHFARDLNLAVQPRGKQWAIYKTGSSQPVPQPGSASVQVLPTPIHQLKPGSVHPLIESYLGRTDHQNPRLSVIIAACNTAPFIRRCLDSVLGQTYPHLEILVCDDASTDGTPAIIREYMTSYPDQVKGIFLTENRGVGAARNCAIEQACGEYITCLDSDDFYADPRKLEYELALVMAYREQHGKDVIAYSRVVDVDEDGGYLSEMPLEKIKQGMIFDDVVTLACLPRDYVLRRDILLGCGLYPDWREYEDWDLRIRLSKAHEFHATGIQGTALRQRRGSLITGSRFSALYRLWPIFCASVEKFVPDEQKKEDLSYKFDLTLNEIRNGGSAGDEVRVLRVACAERLKLINELHQAAQDRLDIINRQQSEIQTRDELIQRLTNLSPSLWIYKHLPQSFRQSIKDIWKRINADHSR